MPLARTLRERFLRAFFTTTPHKVAAIQGVAVDSTMFEYQDWTFNANGRTLVARVELDGDGGGTINRYRLSPGPAQSGLCIKVASQEEAAKRLETEVEKLLGPEW
ncbi:hypothetical protein [Stenotrophomonas riyadhensis]|nr:hypothetical protein [Stenotrophomonas sp. CFS3442]